MDGIHVDKCDCFGPRLVVFENVSIIFMMDLKKEKHYSARLDFRTLGRYQCLKQREACVLLRRQHLGQKSTEGSICSCAFKSKQFA